MLSSHATSKLKFMFVVVIVGGDNSETLKAYFVGSTEMPNKPYTTGSVTGSPCYNVSGILTIDDETTKPY